MTPVILPWRYPCLTTTGVTVTVPPNLLTTKIRVHAPPILMTQGRIGQTMATARRTSGWRGQKINTLHVSTLQGNYSHRIKRRKATPEATFFVFLFYSLCFHPFYHECNPSPPLGSYKRGVRGGKKGRKETTPRTHLNRIQTSRTTTHKRPGTCSLSQKLVTPTTSTPVQGNTKRNETHWTLGRSCPNQYTSLCPLCTPSGSRCADANSLVALFRHPVL
jgi:hypothetical protein